MIYPIELSKLYSGLIPEYEEALGNFIKKGCFIGGEEVALFEKEAAEYLDAEYVVGCGNGTHALQLSLLASDIGSGDEVITVANTYYATVRAIIDVGAEPVFCDVNESGLIDVSKIELLITEKTKAVLPVHLYGIAVDLDHLNMICKKHNLKLIEDCSHAFGSLYRGKKIGSDSYCACFSLYPTKNLGAMGDAGMIAVRDAELADKIRKIRYYTSDPERNIFQARSLHSRLDSLHACMLRVSLKHVDEWNQRRLENAHYYFSAFKGKIPYIKLLEQEGTVPYVFPVIVKDQDDFISYMEKKGILAQVHYRPELHKISHISKRTYTLRETEYLNSSVVSIPVSPTITEDELHYIAASVLAYFE